MKIFSLLPKEKVTWNFLSLSKSPRAGFFGTDLENWETLDLFMVGIFPCKFSSHERWTPVEGFWGLLDLCCSSYSPSLPLSSSCSLSASPLHRKSQGLDGSICQQQSLRRPLKIEMLLGGGGVRQEKSCLCSTNNLYLEFPFSFSFEILYSHFT